MSPSGSHQSVDASRVGRGSVVDAAYWQNSSDCPSWTIRVSSLMLSNAKSMGLPFNVAAALGCSPGQERVVTVINPRGQILITAGLQITPEQRTVLSGLASCRDELMPWTEIW